MQRDIQSDRELHVAPGGVPVVIALYVCAIIHLTPCAERVADAIRSHRFRGAARPETLEAKILFDADKLDSIGAIGVARAYAMGGLMNQKLYSEPKENAVATREQHNASHTPVDEYHVKLKHLRERFFTPTAKKIAAERHAFMEKFFEQLTREVKGER